jgi:hypothetical protein
MRKQWCHDHKTWTSDNWKHTRDMFQWVVLHTIPYIRKSLNLENTKGSLQFGMPGSNGKHRGGSVMVWEAILWYGMPLVPLLPFMAELLQEGSTWTGWVIRCIPWSRRYFRTTMQFSEMTMPPFTWLELLSHGSKEHEGELQHLPWWAQSPDLSITEPLSSVFETRVKNRFPPPTSLKKLEDVLQKNGIKFCYRMFKIWMSPLPGLWPYWTQKVV